MSIFSSIVKFLKVHIFDHFTAKVCLVLVTGLCVVSLLYNYFMREDSVSVLTVIGAVVVPFQEGANKVGSILFKAEEERMDLVQARERIAELESQNADLNRKLDEADSLFVENEELRSLLYAKKRLSDYEMLEAEVIGNDGINCFERFTINRGSMDGIKPDMNVINNDGLIGIVTEVGLNYSIVTSIIEDGMNVSAMTKNGHENCIVSGDLKNSGMSTLILKNALSEVDLTKDSTLVTSYISDKYLPNLLIGYAKDVVLNNGSLTQSGTVKTAVDFSRISYVLVITTMREELQEVE